MADSIGKDFVKTIDADVEISSSGVVHHPMFEAAKSDTEALEGFVETAYGNGLFGKSSHLARLALSIVNRDYSPEDLETCVKYILHAEDTFRNVALLEVGIMPQGPYHQPTAPRDVDLILTMTAGNTESVKKIYDGSGFTPVITEVNVYAGIEGDVANAFCKLLPAYREARDGLMKAVPASIARALDEL